MVGFGLKFLCEELGVLEVVGDKEMGFNLDFVMGFLDFYFVVDFSLILYDDFDELLRLDRVGFVFDQNDYLGKFEKQ